MKNLRVFTIALLIGLMGCSKSVTIQPEIYCPKPTRPVIIKGVDDKVLLRTVNDLVDYSLGLESTVKCYEDSLKK
jgi:hypothetical protein